MAVSIPIITEFVGDGIKKAQQEFKQLEGAGAKAAYGIKKAALPATAALAGLGAILVDATKGAIEDAAAQELLAGNLRRATGATDEQIAAVEEWIGLQGQLLGIADDDLRPALSKLARATGSVTKAQELAAAAMDIAAATGKPLEGVIGALEKAYGGNVGALKKLAPEYQDLIKDGATFEEVMDAIAFTTGGAATDAADTAAGRFKRMKLSLDETKESIGAALLPAVEAMLPFLQKFSDWAQKNPELLTALIIGFGGLAAAIIAVNIAMMANPISLIIAGVMALVAGIVIAYKKFETFRNIVDAVFGGIKWWINNVSIPLFNILKDTFKTIFNAIATVWNNTFGKLSFKVPSWVPGIGGKGFDVPEIPMLANGGIVTGPTLAMIGEAGPEAVIPLDRMGGVGDTNVTIHVNGGDPQQIVDALTRWTRQNGALPLPVSA